MIHNQVLQLPLKRLKDGSYLFSLARNLLGNKATTLKNQFYSIYHICAIACYISFQMDFGNENDKINIWQLPVESGLSWNVKRINSIISFVRSASWNSITDINSNWGHVA